MAKNTNLRVAPGATDVKPDFVMYFSAKAAEVAGEDQGPTVVVTASSDEIDLGNDRFALGALKQMQQTFGGMTIFLNHRYTVPEDVFGTVLSTELKTREGFHDLDLTIAVEASSDRAMKSYAMIKNGVRLGVSVGVLVMDADYLKGDEDEDDRILEITDIIPLEASIVGIPANRRSWVHGARKAAGLLVGDEEEEDEAMRIFHEDPRLLFAIGDEAPDGAYRDEAIKGVVGGHSPPVMDKGVAWGGSEAVGRMRKWASSDGSGSKDKMTWGKYKTGFAWFDDGNRESFGGYKMPHHDIVDGGLKTHFRGCAAAAVVLSGGRGGVNIPEGDVGGCKAHIARHYHQFDEKAPWERKSGEDWLDIEKEVSAELAELVSIFGEDSEESSALTDFLNEIANAPIVDVTGEDADQAHKGVREDYAAEEFCDEVYSMFRNFYYGLYELIASDQVSPVKRQVVVGQLTELQGMILEALDKTLDYLSEGADKEVDALAQLGERDKALRERFEAAEKLVALAQSFETAVVAHEALEGTHKALVEQCEAQTTELEEARTVARDIMGLLNEIMDLPLPRKVPSAQLMSELAEKYPFLVPQVRAELAHRRAG